MPIVVSYELTEYSNILQELMQGAQRFGRHVPGADQESIAYAAGRE
jgi:hypothetical protein